MHCTHCLVRETSTLIVNFHHKTEEEWNLEISFLTILTFGLSLKPFKMRDFWNAQEIQGLILLLLFCLITFLFNVFSNYVLFLLNYDNLWIFFKLMLRSYGMYVPLLKQILSYRFLLVSCCEVLYCTHITKSISS